MCSSLSTAANIVQSNTQTYQSGWKNSNRALSIISLKVEVLIHIYSPPEKIEPQVGRLPGGSQPELDRDLWAVWVSSEQNQKLLLAWPSFGDFLAWQARLSMLLGEHWIWDVLVWESLACSNATFLSISNALGLSCSTQLYPLIYQTCVRLHCKLHDRPELEDLKLILAWLLLHAVPYIILFLGKHLATYLSSDFIDAPLFRVFFDLLLPDEALVSEDFAGFAVGGAVLTGTTGCTLTGCCRGVALSAPALYAEDGPSALICLQSYACTSGLPSLNRGMAFSLNVHILTETCKCLDFLMLRTSLCLLP